MMRAFWHLESVSSQTNSERHIPTSRQGTPAPKDKPMAGPGHRRPPSRSLPAPASIVSGHPQPLVARGAGLPGIIHTHWPSGRPHKQCLCFDLIFLKSGS